MTQHTWDAMPYTCSPRTLRAVGLLEEGVGLAGSVAAGSVSGSGAVRACMGTNMWGCMGVLHGVHWVH